MADLYHQITPDNYLDFGVTKNPKLPDHVSFLTGALITRALAKPLVFQVDFPSRDEVPHLIGDRIPVASDYLVKTLQGCGVDNFQVFPAVLRNPKTHADWDGFCAFNALGLVAAAKLDRSRSDVIMEADPEGAEPALRAITDLTLDARKTRGLLMFRLAEDPTILLIHDRVNRYIDQHDPPDGWGFDAVEVPAV
jgi:hypothetical protein